GGENARRPGRAKERGRSDDRRPRDPDSLPADTRRGARAQAMRILSARISNYRVHCRDEPLEVRFDPSLHVIHGPNEAGKSTLIEAIAAALFERCKVSGGLVDAMRPYHGGGYPEV